MRTSRLEYGEKKSDLKTLGILFLVSFVGMMLSFLPTMIRNGGIFLYYGDFNSQQMMFYYHANEMVREGSFGWDWGTDLGSNFIGSYSFYLLGSPFFWLSTLFPLNAVKYLIPWLLALKTSVAAVSAYAYIRRFVESPNSAFVGAMLYAYSGFQVYNVFFNHFHDVTAFFPLLLLSFEQLTQDKRRGVFAVCVGLCAAISYFFFVGEVVFMVIYFFIRCMDEDFEMNFKTFGSIIFEAVLGVGLSCIILLPAVYDVITNPRLESRLYGTNMIVYSDNKRIARIIQAFFMMSDMPARTNILESDTARWASIAGYLPMFSMAGVIAYLRDKIKSWASKLVIVSGIMMCIPILNSIFVAFNGSYYARWYYMPIMIMCFMTAKMLDEDPDKLKKGFIPTAVIAGVFLVTGILPQEIDGEVVWGQNYQYKELYIIQLIVTLVLTIVLGIIVYALPRGRNFGRIVSGTTAAACIITMFAGVNFGAVQDGNHDEYIEYAINGSDNLDMDELDEASDVNDLYEDNTFFRIDTSASVDNWCMYWGLSSMRTFHSVVPSSIMEFYTSIGQTRDVASRMDTDLYALRSLFSVRYYFNRASDDSEPSQTISNLVGFTYLDTQNDFDIYENQYWIPMGFTYDYYTDDDVIQDTEETKRPNVLLQAVVLESEQIAKYADILEEYEQTSKSLSDAKFMEVCEEKRSEGNCCYYFSESSEGFEAKINLDSEKLLFFSVPYEDGWSATINGEEVEIERVSYGFMAVRCVEGENEIVFSYETSGFSIGKAITAASAGVLVVYIVVGIIYDRFKKRRVSANGKLISQNTNSEPIDEIPSQKAAQYFEDVIISLESVEKLKDAQSDIWKENNDEDKGENE